MPCSMTALSDLVVASSRSHQSTTTLLASSEWEFISAKLTIFPKTLYIRFAHHPHHSQRRRQGTSCRVDIKGNLYTRPVAKVVELPEMPDDGVLVHANPAETSLVYVFAPRIRGRL